MKSTIIRSTLAAAVLAASGIAQAGTVGITGQYSGTHSLDLYNAAAGLPAPILGSSTTNPNNLWDFDFDLGTFFLAPGTLTTSFTYLPAGAFALVDNADGTYTGTYDFSFGPSTVVTTTTTWDITQVGSLLTLVTLDTESDGIPGTTFVNNFGSISPTWNGTASAVPVPAAAWLFGSGLLGLVGIARRRRKTA